MSLGSTSLLIEQLLMIFKSLHVGAFSQAARISENAEWCERGRVLRLGAKDITAKVAIRIQPRIQLQDCRESPCKHDK